MSHRPAFDPDSASFANDDPTWGELSPQDADAPQDGPDALETEAHVPAYTGRLICLSTAALMTEDLSEIETLEPTCVGYDDDAPRYIVGVRGFCGSLHHMHATAHELALLIAW